jgi:hypothetical protein
VPVKSAAQQATLMLYKTRELPVKQRTMGINALRSHLSEFGIVAAKRIGRAGELICKRLDLRFQALPDEITARHSSLGAKFGEWIDVVKDAIGRSKERPSQATGYGTGGAGASEARVLDNIESTSPMMLGPLNE